MPPRGDHRNERQTVDDGKSVGVGTEQPPDGRDGFWSRLPYLRVGREPHDVMLIPSVAVMKYLLGRVIRMLSYYISRPRKFETSPLSVGIPRRQNTGRPVICPAAA